MAISDHTQLIGMRNVARSRVGKIALLVLLAAYLVFVWGPSVNTIYEGENNAATVRSDREQLLALIRVAHTIDLAPQPADGNVLSEIANHARSLGVAVTLEQKQVIFQLKDVSSEDLTSVVTESKVRGRLRLKAGRVHLTEGGWQGEMTFVSGEVTN